MSNTDKVNINEHGTMENTSPDMCCIVVDVINETNVSFLPDYTLLAGKWIRMPVSIPANQSEESFQAFKSISRHHGVGIKGVVCYTIDHSSAAIFIRWDIPLSGIGLESAVTCKGSGLETYDIHLTTTLSFPHNYKSVLHISDSVRHGS